MIDLITFSFWAPVMFLGRPNVCPFFQGLVSAQPRESSLGQRVEVSMPSLFHAAGIRSGVKGALLVLSVQVPKGQLSTQSHIES